MSFAYEIKNEICHNRPFRQRRQKALAYGLLLFGKTFGPDSISIHTEHRTLARLYADSISDLVGLRGSITMREVRRSGRSSIFVVTVDSVTDRIAVLSFFGCRAGEDCCQIRRELLADDDMPVFISGAFLACGPVTGPEKSYQAEFVTPHQALCGGLETLLSEMLSPPKRTERRNDYVLYYKESEQIEDLLTLIGAPKSSLELMEVKIVKEVRNRVNRKTNCETANITKTVEAALEQIAAIRLIESSCDIHALDADLRYLARLRLENPDLSLRELGQAFQTPILPSGVTQRLRRILFFAHDLGKHTDRE